MSYNSPFTGNVVQPTDVSYRSVTLAANTQLEWPINGNATDDYAARIMDVTASSAGLQLWMPPANQTSVGNDAMIRNVGANAFDVYTFNGATPIVNIPAGEAKYIYITTNNTTSGTWGTLDFGSGGSSASAAALAGFGLTATGSTLSQSAPVQSLINASTFGAAQRAQAVVWNSGVGTANLPLATTLGNNWFTIFKNNGTGTLTINTTGGELIDGSTTKIFNPNESCFIVCTGTSYITVGYGVSTLFSFTVLTKPVVSGNYTLTASEASNNIHIFTGTLSGNVTVTYPPVVNFYVVSNQTVAGGFTLTVTTGIGGSATAQIPPAGQATLICDGTNFLNANTFQAGATAIQLVDGSAGSPSLAFALETNTGVYRPGAGRFGITVLGSQIVDVTNTGVAITGTGNFTGGVSGGVF